MKFYKTVYKDELIFIIDDEIINDIVMKKLISNLKPNNKKIGIDMKNVKSIQSDIFIRYLLENKIKLFNLQNEVLTYLALILKEGFLKSYMSKNDFREDKRELIRRKFLVA